MADARTVDIQTHTGELDGEPVYWREGATPGDRPPVLYVHGVPTSSDIWVGFLERTGGVAPDLPGFGLTSKRGDLDYSIGGIDRFVERFLAEREIDRLRLVVHDWGAAALAFAQRFPERIDRLVVIDGVPLLPGYHWHRIARVWRTRGLGELSMGFSSRRVLAHGLRRSTPTAGPSFDALVRSVHAHFDQGTQRAILRLYRSADPEVLTAAGARLGEVTAPALVVWGALDPYIPTTFAGAYADVLPGAHAHVVPGAGHWPWLDVPGVIDEVVAFLDHPGTGRAAT